MGRILSCTVNEGQSVRKGQLLVQIKSDDLKQQSEQTKFAIKEAQAAFDNAQTNYDRFKTLFGQQSCTKFELDNAKMQYDMATQKVNQAKSMSGQIASVLSESNIYAPFSGTIVSKNCDAGAMASPGMPLMTIESTGELVVKALVPESEIKNVKTGQNVTIHFQSTNETAQGKVTLVNSSSQFTGSQYEVEIRPYLTAEQRSFMKSGMYANITMPRTFRQTATETCEIANSVVVPKSALVEFGQLYGVYTVTQQNKAVLRWVKLGKDMGDKVEITSGLNDKEAYVVQSQGKLFNGAKVKAVL